MSRVEVEEEGEGLLPASLTEIGTLPKDGMDASFLFYAGLTEIGFTARLVEIPDLVENGLGVMRVEVTDRTEVDQIEILRRRFDLSPVGRLVTDVSDGYYEPFMPEERYMNGSRRLTARHLGTDPQTQKRAFLTSFERHLFLRYMRAIGMHPREIVGRMSEFTMDRGAMTYRDQLQHFGVSPFTQNELLGITVSEIRSCASYLKIDLPTASDEN